MDNATLLIVAMVEQCRALIQQSDRTVCDLPDCVGTSHLLAMCNEIESNAETWPSTKLHRWIGYIQCGMLANRILDIGAAKSMFDAAKRAYGSDQADQDMLDHLNPNNSFRLDIGGEA